MKKHIVILLCAMLNFQPSFAVKDEVIKILTKVSSLASKDEVQIMLKPTTEALKKLADNQAILLGTTVGLAAIGIGFTAWKFRSYNQRIERLQDIVEKSSLTEANIQKLITDLGKSQNAQTDAINRKLDQVQNFLQAHVSDEPQKLTDALKNANQSISQLQDSVTTVLQKQVNGQQKLIEITTLLQDGNSNLATHQSSLEKIQETQIEQADSTDELAAHVNESMKHLMLLRSFEETSKSRRHKPHRMFRSHKQLEFNEKKLAERLKSGTPSNELSKPEYHSESDDYTFGER